MGWEVVNGMGRGGEGLSGRPCEPIRVWVKGQKLNWRARGTEGAAGVRWVGMNVRRVTGGGFVSVRMRVSRGKTLVSRTHVHMLLRVRLGTITVASVLISTIRLRELHLFSRKIGGDALAVRRVSNERQDRSNAFHEHCTLSRVCIVKRSLGERQA